MIRHVGFDNPHIGMFKPVHLTLHIYGVWQFVHATSTKSNIRQGGLNLYSTIILDCQTKTAISCSEDCIAYKTCTARKKRR
ncbi:MAG: hypothetical protein ABR909_01030 [Candidatus Bathyarchaeia archaeon]